MSHLNLRCIVRSTQPSTFWLQWFFDHSIRPWLIIYWFPVPRRPACFFWGCILSYYKLISRETINHKGTIHGVHIKYGCKLAAAIFFSQEPGGTHFLTITCATEFTCVSGSIWNLVCCAQARPSSMLMFLFCIPWTIIINNNLSPAWSGGTRNKYIISHGAPILLTILTMHYLG